MNLLPLILEALKQRGGAAVWTWIGLMLATWLVFAYGTERPLTGTALVGAGFIYGVVVLGGSMIAARLRARRTAEEVRSPPAKKRRKRGG
ncbi:MAG TPA: hypothetical protein VFB81_22150 [Myxococcales bacterium]|nr:hypothetical protein [Myxococcales bacterium]